MPLTSMLKQLQNSQMIFIACFAISASMLLGALAFEHIGGLAPCKLCIWQRWPHVFIIIFAGLGLLQPARPTTNHIETFFWLSLILIAALTTAGIGIHHVGVEQSWWEGFAGCSSQLGTDLDLSTLTDTLLATPVVKCDEIAWQLFGISMAGWNAIISAGAAGLVLYGLLMTIKGSAA